LHYKQDVVKPAASYNQVFLAHLCSFQYPDGRNAGYIATR
jgi:hypothetical protein